MVLIGASTAESAFFSEQTGVDWNVVFLLLGMMVIVGVLRQTGVFEFLAIWSAKRAKAARSAMMVVLVVITALASALLDNVTTVLLIAPVTLLVCERLGLNPVPYLHRRGDGVEHRRHGDAHRRPAQHHHREPVRPVLQRLPGQPRADRRRAMVVFIGLAWVLFGAAHSGTTPSARRGDGARGARGDPGRTVARPDARRAGPDPGGLRRPPGPARRAGRGRAARCRSRVALSGLETRSSSQTSSGRPWSSSPACSSWSARWSRSG